MQDEEKTGAVETLARIQALGLPGDPAFAAVSEAPVVLATEPVDARTARRLWEILRNQRSSLGLTPVVVDEQVPLELDAAAAAEHLAASAPLDPETFIDARRGEHKRFWLDYLADAEAGKKGTEPARLPDELGYPELARRCRAAGVDCPERDPYADELWRLASLPPGIADREPPAGDFQYAVRDERFASSGLDIDPLRVRVLLMAAPAHELLAHLGYGGWNECPQPPDHVALHRSWHERFGAELAFVGPDTLEVAVARPPATTSALRDLAWEQFVYCSDIVYQGTGTLDALAIALAGSPRWFFWWD